MIVASYFTFFFLPRSRNGEAAERSGGGIGD